VGPPSGGVSRILVTGRLPFRDAALAGLALTGAATSLLEEGARVARPAARMLLQPVTPGLRARAAAAGTTVVLDAEETLVVARQS
jgi:uracil-DNA glycosylase